MLTFTIAPAADRGLPVLSGRLKEFLPPFIRLLQDKLPWRGKLACKSDQKIINREPREPRLQFFSSTSFAYLAYFAVN
jgi:hypothetical protein